MYLDQLLVEHFHVFRQHCSHAQYEVDEDIADPKISDNNEESSDNELSEDNNGTPVDHISS